MVALILSLRPKVVHTFAKSTAKSLNKQAARLKESKSACTEHTAINNH